VLTRFQAPAPVAAPQPHTQAQPQAYPQPYAQPQPHAQPVGPPRGGFAGAFAALFADPRWAARYWIVPVVCLIPVVNLVLLRGWRFDLTQRLARQESPTLPPPSRIVNFLLNGVFLWLMTFIYHLPHALLAVFHVYEMMHVIKNGGEGLVATLVMIYVVSIVVTVVTWPLYRAAMLRYAVTGSLWSFVMVPQNFCLVLLNFPGFVLLWLKVLLVTILFALVTGVLTATMIGILVVAGIIIPLYYATTGHLFAQFASKLAERHGWFEPAAAGAVVSPGVVMGPRRPKPVGLANVASGLVLSVAAFALLLGGAAVLGLYGLALVVDQQGAAGTEAFVQAVYAWDLPTAIAECYRLYGIPMGIELPAELERLLGLDPGADATTDPDAGRTPEAPTGPSDDPVSLQPYGPDDAAPPTGEGE